MRFVIVVWTLLAGVVPAVAGGAFPDLVAQAEQQQTFVATIAPAITKQCVQQQWGDYPPVALQDWFTALLLSDLSNRAKVMRGALSTAQAKAVREELFFTLADLQPAAFDAIATYAGFTPGRGFGSSLPAVFECQYAGLAKALKQVSPEM